MRIAVVSDIHGNLVALRAVLEHAGEVDAVWCLGDTVGYGPEPDACVREVRDRPHLVVSGNHDLAAVGRIGTEDFNPVAAEAARWTAEQLSTEIREYLLTLPQREAHGEFTLVHGSPRDPTWEYVTDEKTARANFEHFATRYCLIGHTHIPSYFALVHGRVGVEHAADGFELDLSGAGRVILNPGSVGQPRDQDSRASYLLIDLEERRAVWRRVAYDIAATQALMRQHGLPGPLIDRLAKGW